jgi:SSS family transporter
MNALDYSIVILYSIAFLGLGYFFKDQKDGKDYFLGGKSFGWLPLGLSIMATQLSAISFISAPAFVGVREGGGLEWLSYEFGVPLAMIFLMGILVPPLYKSGVVSIYEYLERRFDISSRLLLSFVFLVSRAFATGVMVYAVSIILESVLEISFWQTLIVIGVITLIYSLQGGMKAVVYGDMIQMIILFLGIIICMFYGLHYVGGWDNFLTNLDKTRLDAVDFNSIGLGEGQEFGFWPMLIGGFFLYVSYYGTDQSQAQRTLSAKNMDTVRKTLLFNGLIRFPVTLTYCIMGLIIGTFVFSNPEFMSALMVESVGENGETIQTLKSDRMIPVFIANYLPHGIIGLLIVAILSAAMSTLSSTINSLTAVTMEDFITRFRKVESADYMKVSRVVAFIWGVFCIILAAFTGNIADTVIEAINKVGSVFYGPLLATFLLAITTKTTHAKGANIGLLVGLLVNFYLWLGVGDALFWFWWNAIGAVVTFTVGYIASMVLPGEAKEVDLDFSISLKNVFNREAIILIIFFVIIVLLSLSMKSILG